MTQSTMQIYVDENHIILNTKTKYYIKPLHRKTNIRHIKEQTHYRYYYIKQITENNKILNQECGIIETIQQM